MRRLLAFLRHAYDDRVLSLSDDGDTRSALVDLGPGGDGTADILQVAVRHLVGLGEALRLVLIAEHVISMAQYVVDLLSVELD